MALAEKLKTVAFAVGSGLSDEPGSVRLEWGMHTKYCNDLMYAMSWAYAAKQHNIVVKVYY